MAFRHTLDLLKMKSILEQLKKWSCKTIFDFYAICYKYFSVKRTDLVSKMVCHRCCEISVKLHKYRTNAVANDKLLKKQQGLPYTPPISNQEDLLRIASRIADETIGLGNGRNFLASNKSDSPNDPLNSLSFKQSISSGIPNRNAKGNVAASVSVRPKNIKSLYKHPSVKQIYKDYNNIILPREVLKSDVAPVISLDKNEIDDHYKAQVSVLKVKLKGVRIEGVPRAQPTVTTNRISSRSESLTLPATTTTFRETPNVHSTIATHEVPSTSNHVLPTEIRKFRAASNIRLTIDENEAGPSSGVLPTKIKKFKAAPNIPSTTANHVKPSKSNSNSFPTKIKKFKAALDISSMVDVEPSTFNSDIFEKQNTKFKAASNIRSPVSTRVEPSKPTSNSIPMKFKKFKAASKTCPSVNIDMEPSKSKSDILLKKNTKFKAASNMRSIIAKLVEPLTPTSDILPTKTKTIEATFKTTPIVTSPMGSSNSNSVVLPVTTPPKTSRKVAVKSTTKSVITSSHRNVPPPEQSPNVSKSSARVFPKKSATNTNENLQSKLNVAPPKRNVVKPNYLPYSDSSDDDMDREEFEPSYAFEDKEEDEDVTQQLNLKANTSRSGDEVPATAETKTRKQGKRKLSPSIENDKPSADLKKKKRESLNSNEISTSTRATTPKEQEYNPPTELENINESPPELVTAKAQNVFICSMCNAIFDTKKELLTHQKTHLKCKFCKKQIRTLELLHKHQNETCFINIVKNSPTIILDKIDTVPSVLQKYWKSFQPNEDNVTDELISPVKSEVFDEPPPNIEEVNLPNNPNDDFVEEEAVITNEVLIAQNNETKSDVYCISDSEDDITCTEIDNPQVAEAATSSKGSPSSVIDLTSKSEPQICLDMSKAGNGNIKTASEKEILRSLFKKHSPSKTKCENESQTFSLSDTTIKYTSTNLIILDDMFSELSAYKIPVELESQPRISARFKHEEDTTPTQPMKPSLLSWAAKTCTDVEKRSNNTPLEAIIEKTVLNLPNIPSTPPATSYSSPDVSIVQPPFVSQQNAPKSTTAVSSTTVSVTNTAPLKTITTPSNIRPTPSGSLNTQANKTPLKTTITPSNIRPTPSGSLNTQTNKTPLKRTITPLNIRPTPSGSLNTQTTTILPLTEPSNCVSTTAALFKTTSQVTSAITYVSTNTAPLTTASNFSSAPIILNGNVSQMSNILSNPNRAINSVPSMAITHSSTLSPQTLVAVDSLSNVLNPVNNFMQLMEQQRPPQLQSVVSTPNNPLFFTRDNQTLNNFSNPQQVLHITNNITNLNKILLLANNIQEIPGNMPTITYNRPPFNNSVVYPPIMPQLVEIPPESNMVTENNISDQQQAEKMVRVKPVAELK